MYESSSFLSNILKAQTFTQSLHLSHDDSSGGIGSVGFNFAEVTSAPSNTVAPYPFTRILPDHPIDPTPDRAATNLRASRGGNLVRQSGTSSRYLKLLITGADL